MVWKVVQDYVDTANSVDAKCSDEQQYIFVISLYIIIWSQRICGRLSRVRYTSRAARDGVLFKGQEVLSMGPFLIRPNPIRQISDQTRPAVLKVYWTRPDQTTPKVNFQNTVLKSSIFSALQTYHANENTLVIFTSKRRSVL